MKVFNPLLRLGFDEIGTAAGGLTLAQADARYLKLTGGTITGDVNFPSTGIVMTDESGNVLWRGRLTTAGAWDITQLLTTPGYSSTYGATYPVTSSGVGYSATYGTTYPNTLKTYLSTYSSTY